MKIEILGIGCLKCKELYSNTEEVLKELGIEAELLKVEKISDIMKYKVMITPAIVINGIVKTAGRVPSKAEIITWITSESAK